MVNGYYYICCIVICKSQGQTAIAIACIDLEIILGEFYGNREMQKSCIAFSQR